MRRGDKNLRIYLDNCCYGRPFDDQKDKKINSETLAIIKIQDKIIENKIELATSFILHYENGRKSDDEQKNYIDNFFRTNRKIYIGVEFAEKLKILVKKIMETGIKEKDAYHVACAILAECDFFITVDERLLKYQSEKINLVNPVEFLKNWSDFDE